MAIYGPVHLYHVLILQNTVKTPIFPLKSTFCACNAMFTL